MGMAQEGRADDATAAWQKMLGTLPQDSPWRGAAEQALAESAKRNVASGEPAKGPTAGDVDSAATMSPQDREAMINTMVAGLDEKLRHNPRDTEGWMKLIRSYVVLGKADQARDALNRGIAVFGRDSDEARKFTAFGASLGLAATE
jgi:cytochrome c-type biogenesis protein CcmH